MRNRSRKRPEDAESLRQKIIGLGDYSFRKSYYPELQKRLAGAMDAERRAAEALALVDALLASAPVGLGFLDMDLRFVRVNESLAAITGVPAARLAARRIGEVLPQAPMIERLLDHVIASGESVVDQEADSDTAANPGQVRHWLTSCYPVRIGTEEAIGVGIVVVDITERKCMEAELRESARRKDEFLAMLSHELRNPLAAISGAIETWRLGDPADPIVSRSREVAARQVRHMARLLDDLLNASRVTRGLVELRKELLALTTLVCDAVDATRLLRESKGQEITVSLPPQPVGLFADRDRLAEVLTNLLENAAKYTPPGGHTWVNVDVEGDEVVLRVRDNGIGIAPDLLPRIFDLFAQADRAPDRAQGGLGIGLTLVRQLVEVHGGRVAARSDGPGRGSEFEVRLPGPVSLKPGDLHEAPAAATAAGHPCRVLLVEDNEDAAAVTADVLEMAGYEVGIAPDGPTAITSAVRDHPDVVLVDIGLPGMDGYEVARRLHQQEGLADVPLIALTGYGQEEDRQRTAEAGFARHVTKPYDPEELQQILGRTCA